jgi:outer membrane murein-binding lipoprotein Lpp
MTRAAHDWSDARLDDLAAALEPVPAKVAALGEAMEHLGARVDLLQPMPSQVAVLTAAVERLTDENRTLREELAAMQRQFLQMAWGLIVALVGAAAALISALH